MRRWWPPRGRRCGLAVAALLVLTACGGPESPPEARIRDLVARAEQAAEEHELSLFREHLSQAYEDNHGYDRQTALRLIQGMLLGNRQIHLLSLVREVEVHADTDTASTRVLVAMAGQPIDSVDALLNMNVDLMRFDVQLGLEDGEWRVRAVDWNRARAGDFLTD